jgi:hypothetical protein
MTITDVNSLETPSDDAEGGQSRAWRSLFRRRRPPEPLVINSEVARWHAQEEEPKPEGWAWVEKHALTLPDPRHVKARLRHAAPKVPGIVVKFVLVKTPQVMWTEAVQPIWAGSGKCVNAYVRWVTASHLDAAQQVAEGPLKARTLTTRHTSHGYRIWASIVAALIASGGMAYLYFVQFTDFLVVVFVVLGVLDLIGRAGTEKTKEFAPVYREPLREGMPYKQLTESIQSAFNEIVGVDANGHPLVRVDGICAYNFDREEWRQNISTYQEIKEEHVRSLERSIGAALRSVQVLEVPEVATRRIVVIKNGDPFTNVPSAPWVPPKTKSITEGLLLGKSQTSHPFLVHVAGVHVGVVGASGAGKSEGVIAAIIEGILGTYNAVVLGIDLTEGPLFPIYGDCIQRVAYTPEDADALLDWLLGEIKERAKILGDIARSDDPNDKGREWNAQLAEKYNRPSIHLIVDESPQAVKFNGLPRNSGVPDLAGKLEVISRTGSKHWVTLITGQQKTGKSDSGSTGLSANIMTWLVGPCTQDDANEIFSPELRRAGWAPNMLKPAVRGKSANDAGRVFVKAAGFGPDVYCTWRPMPEEEIKRRRVQRLTIGLPRLENSPQDDTIEAKVVPNMLCALSAAYDDIEPPDDKLPSTMAAEWITEHSREEIDATELAKRLRVELGDLAPRAKSMRNKLRGNCSCYLGEDINAAMEAL